MIEKIKASWAVIKANIKLMIAAVGVGFIIGALTVGPLAALIQYIKDVIK